MQDGVVTQGSRPRLPAMLTVGTVVWLASELMFFGGLFAAYFTLRAETAVWPPDDVTLETAASAVFTVILVVSSGTIHMAGKALERGDRTAVQRWILVTFALGGLFLANQIREFLTLDFSISTHAYGSIYYLMTGFHGLHVAAGLVLLLIGFAMVVNAGTLERRTPAVESVTYYWHFVDVVWVGLFTTIFIIR
ncbi:MAG TPA: heme-copper oxidase subunit III [Acidimicrobiales bacterium]